MIVIVLFRAVYFVAFSFYVSYGILTVSRLELKVT